MKRISLGLSIVIGLILAVGSVAIAQDLLLNCSCKQDETDSQNYICACVPRAAAQGSDVAAEVKPEIIIKQPVQVAVEPVAGAYKVNYDMNDCLSTVPVDEKTYYAGETVTVKFEPVKYKNGLIFYGWGTKPNGLAEYGYNYDNFEMPAEDVELYAICIVPVYPTKTPTTDPTAAPTVAPTVAPTAMP